jgi:hypothetical protein
MFYWLIFSPGSKFEGFGLRFFATPIKSIDTSESIGLLRTLVNVVLVPEDTLSLVFLAIVAIPVVCMGAYIFHQLRDAAIAHQITDSSEK